MSSPSQQPDHALEPAGERPPRWRRWRRNLLRTAALFGLFSLLLNWELICGPPELDGAAPPSQKPAEPVPVAAPAVPADAADLEKPRPGTYHRPSDVRVPKLPTLPSGQLSLTELEEIRKSAVDGVLDSVPARFRELDGKTVTLTGYVIVTQLAEPITEFHLAANAWDACCVGKPPTVFNSVAIQLTAGQRLSNPRLWFATVRGRLRVRPIHEDGALVELYTLTEAAEVRLSEVRPESPKPSGANSAKPSGADSPKPSGLDSPKPSGADSAKPSVPSGTDSPQPRP